MYPHREHSLVFYPPYSRLSVCRWHFAHYYAICGAKIVELDKKDVYLQKYSVRYRLFAIRDIAVTSPATETIIIHTFIQTLRL